MSEYNLPLPQEQSLLSSTVTGESLIENKLQEITVRAANLDNVFDRERILAVFLSHFGTDHPIPVVLERHFWIDPEKYMGGNKYIPIIVEDAENNTIAHIGISYTLCGNYAEIVLPSILPECRPFISVILDSLKEKITAIARCQSWKRLVFMSNTTDPLLQIIAHSFLSAKTISILPSEMKEASEEFKEFESLEQSVLTNHLKEGVQSKYSPVVLMQTNFEAISIESPLYIPQDIRISINEVLRESNINQNKVVKSQPVSSLKAKTWELSRKHFHTLFFLDLRPSAVKKSGVDIKKILKRSKSKLRQRIIVRLSLHDPASPGLYETLKEYGYSYSGIDLVQNEICLLMALHSRLELQQAILYSQDAKNLRDAIIHGITNISNVDVSYTENKNNLSMTNHSNPVTDQMHQTNK
jgi:hypothetical protein